jgi:SPP1 gp7 family putative phage head morphogenesis protein
MPDINKLSDQAIRALLARERQYELRIASVLKKSLNDIRAELSKLYEKYSTDGVLTTADMSRYARYSSMESSLLSKLEPAIKASIAQIKRLTPEQYQAAFFRAAWALDNAASVRLSWGVINMDAIRKAYAITDPNNKAMAEALKNYSMSSRRWIRQAINSGLASGKSYVQMAKDVKDAVNKIHSSAITIVRTEGGAAIAAGTADAYDRAQEQGVEGRVVWISTKDDRTREQHKDMDGQARDDEGLFHFPNRETAPYPKWEGLSAGNRCNCRCNIRFEIDGYAPQLIRTKGQGVLPYMDYRTWEKQFGPKVH